MSWKKILPIVLIAIVVIGAAAGIYIGVTAEKKIGIAIGNLSDPATQEYAQVLQQRLMEEGYAVAVVDSENDQSLQNEQIRQWVKEKYSAVIVSPVMASAVTETIEIAKQANVPMILIDKHHLADTFAVWDRVCYVGSPSIQWGKLQADAVLQWPSDINGDGQISYLLVQDDPANRDQRDGANLLRQSLQADGVTLKEVKKIATNGSQSDCEALCVQALAEFGKDIEVIFCDSDTGALGAKEAIADGGREVGKDIYLVGIGDTQQARSAVASGKISAVIYRDYHALAEKTAEVLKQLLDKQTPEAVNLVDRVIITPENVVDYLIP